MSCTLLLQRKEQTGVTSIGFNLGRGSLQNIPRWASKNLASSLGKSVNLSLNLLSHLLQVIVVFYLSHRVRVMKALENLKAPSTTVTSIFIRQRAKVITMQKGAEWWAGLHERNLGSRANLGIHQCVSAQVPVKSLVKWGCLHFFLAPRL